MAHAWLLNKNKNERERLATTSVKHKSFSSGCRDYHLMDTPGANMYKKHMISSLVYADAAVLVIDASDMPHF